MLSALALAVKGRHQDLLPPTNLEVELGTLLLVAADRQDTRTALALTLTGRMEPSAGAVTWGQDTRLATLRRHSALLDAVGVNEPEHHLSVQDLVTEDLSLLPRRHRRANASRDWLKVHSFLDVAENWADELPALRRIQLLTALSLASPDVDLLVVDSPDRHSPRPGDWLPFLDALATDPGRPLAVVAIVSTIPRSWHGAAVTTEEAPRS